MAPTTSWVSTRYVGTYRGMFRKNAWNILMMQNYPYQFSLTCLKGLTQPTLNAFFKLNFSDFFAGYLLVNRQPKLAIGALRSTLPEMGLNVKPNISKKITLSYFFVKKINFLYIAVNPALNKIFNCNVTRSNWICSPKSLYCIVKLVF